ncbi:MAG: DUF192 domain-containing protein [Methylobacteriaceae bacterium]|nr:DUF192 domain-containing protein [Methylobacteriaceae bacterium]
MPHRLSLLALVVIALIGCSTPRSRADANLERLEFVTRTGAHAFEVEVMRTPEEQARGLMFRRYMPADRGMLFAFGVVAPVSFWMRNTYIPLDMIFLDRKGRVVSIAADTEPLSERLIPSGGPVWAVVELNAGEASKIDLKIGDVARNPVFAP